MGTQELQKELGALEESIAQCEFGSVLYDHLNGEIEALLSKIDRIMRQTA